MGPFDQILGPGWPLYIAYGLHVFDYSTEIL